MYRPYSCNEVKEIVCDSSTEIGYVYQTRCNDWEPRVNESNGIFIEGMYFMECFPEGIFRAEPFEIGSRHQLDVTLGRVPSHFSNNHMLTRIDVAYDKQQRVINPNRRIKEGDSIIAQWNDFALNACALKTYSI